MTGALNARGWRERTSAFATAVMLGCALAVTVIVVRREFTGRDPAPTARFTDEPGWERYTRGGHWIGPRTAKVVLVEFSDFQCPWCARLADVLGEARRKYPTDFAVVYRHWPIGRIHAHAVEAAIASECSAAQGQFAAMHDLLFAKRDSIGILAWAVFAERAGVRDSIAFSRCMADPRTKAALQRDSADAARLRVRGTPTSIVNGVRFSGTLSQATLDSLIESALASAKSR